MRRFSPAKGITRIVIPETENNPELPVLFGPEGSPLLKLEGCELTGCTERCKNYLNKKT